MTIASLLYSAYHHQPTKKKKSNSRRLSFFYFRCRTSRRRRFTSFWMLYYLVFVTVSDSLTNREEKGRERERDSFTLHVNRCAQTSPPVIDAPFKTDND